MMTDSRLQRLNMVESQVRPSDVTDRRILRVMLDVPREAFVPPALAATAYRDERVPVKAANGTQRCLLAPRTFAKLLQLAEIAPEAVVLDVGCATGYSTAVLAQLAQRVVAVECDADLARQASEGLQRLGLSNAAVQKGPLTGGAPQQGPYDAIVLNGAVPAAPDQLLGQLRDGGRLVGIVVTDGAVGQARVWRRTGKTTDHRTAFEAAADVLPGFQLPAGFVF